MESTILSVYKTLGVGKMFPSAAKKAQGKDGFPYPVDREVYDHSIKTIQDALNQAKIDNKEKYNAIKRLNKYL